MSEEAGNYIRELQACHRLNKIHKMKYNANRKRDFIQSKEKIMGPVNCFYEPCQVEHGSDGDAYEGKAAPVKLQQRTKELEIINGLTI